MLKIGYVIEDHALLVQKFNGIYERFVFRVPSYVVYLHGRRQLVFLNGTSSDIKFVCSGVP